MYNPPSFDADGNNYTAPTGARMRLNGLQYLATQDPEFQKNNPEASYMMQYRYNAGNDTLAYKLGNYLREGVDQSSPTLVGRAFNKGPLVGALAGGIPAAALGYLAGVIRDRASGGDSAQTIGLSAGALGAALGAGVAALRKESSVLYKDPRNFILEKLQDATDVDFATRAKLALEVRNMDQAGAASLMALIRQAGGFAVGAIIAKFLLGAKFMGSLLGGVLGMGVASYNSLKQNTPFTPSYY